MICNIRDPLTGEDYTRDPRNIARKADNYLKSTGIADTAYFGPGGRSSSSSTTSATTRTSNAGYYYIDSVEGRWNRGRDEKPEPGLQAPLQGRLLPRAADRPAAGHPHRDDADA